MKDLAEMTQEELAKYEAEVLDCVKHEPSDLAEEIRSISRKNELLIMTIEALQKQREQLIAECSRRMRLLEETYGFQPVMSLDDYDDRAMGPAWNRGFGDYCAWMAVKGMLEGENAH